MTEYILILIAVLTAFFGGFFMGLMMTTRDQKHDIQRECRELSAHEMKAVERHKKEYENFLNYTGDEQKDIDL